MRFVAICKEGDYESFSYRQRDTANMFAENHITQTGHIVFVKEVYKV